MQRKTRQKVKKRDCLNFRRMHMTLFPDQKFSLGTLFFWLYPSVGVLRWERSDTRYSAGFLLVFYQTILFFKSSCNAQV